MLLKRSKDIVTCGTKLRLFKNHRQISIVRGYACSRTTNANTRNGLQALPISLGNLFAFCDFIVQMTKIANSHRRGKFIHFCITANVLNRFLVRDAEILPAIELGF